MQQTNSLKNDSSSGKEQGPAEKIAENPNPRANENIKHTPFEEKKQSDPGDDVGTEITDGEGG